MSVFTSDRAQRIQEARTSVHRCEHACQHVVVTGDHGFQVELAGRVVLQNVLYDFVVSCKRILTANRIVHYSFSDYHGREWHREWERRHDGWYEKTLSGWVKDIVVE